jgi:hypothetical protein
MARFERCVQSTAVAAQTTAQGSRKVRHCTRRIVSGEPTLLDRLWVVAWWPLHESDEAGKLGLAADRLDQHAETYRVKGERFDGDDYVDLKNIDVTSKQLWIIGWLRPSSFQTPDARIISKATGIDSKDHYWMLSTVKQGNEIVLRGRIRTLSQGTTEIAGSRELSLDVWTLAALTYDGQHVRIYQDGQLVGEMACEGELATNSHCQAWIGDNPSGQGDRPFRGDLEHIALFNRALHPGELRAIYESRDQRAHIADAPQIKIDPTVVPALDDMPPMPRVGPVIQIDPSVTSIEPLSVTPLYREVWVERTVFQRCYCKECRVDYLKPVTERVQEMQLVEPVGERLMIEVPTIDE